tara:strand:+ start:132107 stop:132280 length:174 start_codon:yes stop_codon:yes gene_type:complete
LREVARGRCDVVRCDVVRGVGQLMEQRVVLVACNEGGDVGEAVCVDLAAKLMRWPVR